MVLHAGYRVPAGEDTVVNSEAAALERGGHDVLCHVVPNPDRTLPAVAALARSLDNRVAAAQVDEEIRRFRPDVVHVHNTWFALSSSAVAAAGRAGVPVVMTVHNYRLGCLSADLFRDGDVCTACVGRAPLPGVLHGCYRNSRVLSAIAATEVTLTRRRGTLVDHVDRFVAPSGFVRDRLVDIGLPADRISVKPHFVTDPGPRTTPPSHSDEIVYIGRLAAGKGLETLLRAWERVESAQRDSARPFRLSVIGDGPLADDLREAAPRTVTFEGWIAREAVIDRLRSARAFVFPSAWYEPFGMVLVEALSAGAPVVVSTASEAASITGAPDDLVVPIGDAAALADAVLRLTDERVDRLGPDNRDRFERRYTEEVGLRDLERLYADVVAGASR